MNKKLMLVGIKDKVGKSTIAIALERYFTKKGLNVVPFKAIDIVDSVYKIEEEKMIGYMQSLQCDACNIEKDMKYNPIVVSIQDEKTKVLVHGKKYCEMAEFDYKVLKNDMESIIDEAYEQIKNDGDILILEGTGEALEFVNRENEFINFKIAKKANADVILVADYKDVNSFATLVGTMDLLTKEERKSVKGIIINNAIGDLDYIKEGMNKISRRKNLNILGVIPEENMDMLSEKNFKREYRMDKKKELVIGVIKLSGFSGMTDFYPFEDEKEISFIFIEDKKDIKNCDFIILPDTKTPIRDLKWLKENGFYEELKEASEHGKWIMGICAGFQMLGHEIEDAYGLDEKGTKIEGLNLIPFDTRYTFINKTVITKGKICRNDTLLKDLANTDIYGYEIHNGDFKILDGAENLMVDKMNNIIGISNKQGNVFGTFMHGIFSKDGFRKGLLKILKEAHGVVTSNKEMEDEAFNKYKMKIFDKYLEIIESHIDVKEIEKLMDKE